MYSGKRSSTVHGGTRVPNARVSDCTSSVIHGHLGPAVAVYAEPGAKSVTGGHSCVLCVQSLSDPRGTPSPTLGVRSLCKPGKMEVDVSGDVSLDVSQSSGPQIVLELREPESPEYIFLLIVECLEIAS